MFVYTVLCKLTPPKHVAEARSMPFEAMGQREVLFGLNQRSDSEEVGEVKVDADAKV